MVHINLLQRFDFGLFLLSIVAKTFHNKFCIGLLRNVAFELNWWIFWRVWNFTWSISICQVEMLDIASGADHMVSEVYLKLVTELNGR